MARFLRVASVFMARHLFATIALTTLVAVCWSLLYFILLLWAMATGESLGSPLSYPLGLLTIAILGPTISLFLYLPSITFGEWLARKFGWAPLVQIPLALLAFVILIAFFALFENLLPSQPTDPDSLARSRLLFLTAYSLPLAIYWLLYRFTWLPKVVAKTCRRLLKRLPFGPKKQAKLNLPENS